MDGQVAIVTGGGRGIGYHLAEELLKKGYTVCIADYNTEEGEDASKELNKKFAEGKTTFVKCDVTSQNNLEELFAAVKFKYGRLDIVCNNAGFLGEGQWERTIDTNVKGVIRGSQLAIEHMRKDKGGHGGIVMNTASFSGFFPCDELYSYCASKFAIVGYTRSLALNKEIADNGLKFVLLCPHATDTKMIDGVPSQYQVESQRMHFSRPETVAQEAMKLLEDGTKSGAALITTVEKGAYFHTFEEM